MSEPLPLAGLAPYVPRRMGALGVWEANGFRLKAYGIQADPHAAELLPAAVVDAARQHAAQALQSAHAEGGHYGLGYCMVHAGEEANWLLVDWWKEGGIACQRLLAAPCGSPTTFVPITGRPLLACVWELVVTGFERDAWVRHVLTPVPDGERYLAEWLPEGMY